ncbi:MAG: cold shock domain-containing protein [Beijerinckiaceae bacterium]|jgi:cold shock CspA family protein|nr:cold shock domain-containing protein [Beijerinckiaceae bacterium]
METLAEIDFQNIEDRGRLREDIERHLAELENRYGRITAARVVLKGPGARRHAGGLYEVNIRLALPDGKDVVVERTPDEDERHADIRFAINDAFHRARRQLQDQARRIRGQVKQHEAQPVGVVVRLDPSGEFGFLQASDGHEIYFHHNSVLDAAFGRLQVGARVAFVEEAGNKGPQASTVRLLGKHGLRA